MATVDKDFKVKNGIVVGSTISATSSTLTAAPLRIPHGTPPASPQNGDIWTTTGGMYVRINGQTIGPLSTGGGGGSGSVSISDTPPFPATHGDFWFNSSTARLFIYYEDGTSNQWIEASSPVPNIGQIDGGYPDSNYGGTTAIDLGTI